MRFLGAWGHQGGGLRDLGTSGWGFGDHGDTRVGFEDTEVLGLGVTGILGTSEVEFWGLEDITDWV